MIIDRILDRKEYGYYKPDKFYKDMLDYGGYGKDISLAMDYGTEEDVRRELCKYIDGCEYNPEIKDYINSVSWLTEG